VRVYGTVQGVGFRPFVRNLATELSLNGIVGNDTSGVFIEVEGDPGAIGAFLGRLQSEHPPLCSIERVTTGHMASRGEVGFEIAASNATGEHHALVAPDSATCSDCLRELFDPGDRRYLYPFINCTNCGPRFTIVRDVPYDRPNTTMAGFAMCATCRREYEDPADRRFHAQPTCCPACGPSLRLLGADGVDQRHPRGPLGGAASMLREGKVVAVKGLGGYHLAVLASSEEASASLRSRKHREDKPFAVMVADVGTARAICELSAAEEQLLASPSRPIVLLRRRPDRPADRGGEVGHGPRATPIAPSVAPGNRYLGLMLPYTPLHYLLSADLGEPFVLTSGNVSDEPIAYLDDDAFARLSGIADAFLTHDRPVHMRTDDSVARTVRGVATISRRSRGFVPQPVAMPLRARRAVLACGAELKNTFCLATGRRAFLSHHIGDLENYETLRSFKEGIEHFCRLFDIRPEVVAHDLHPEYLSTKYALARDALARDGLALDGLARDGLETFGVQHHHAHLASCLVDNAETGPVIGVAFDGLGYGEDGTLWGGEILVAGLASFERVGHLEPVPMPGGTAAIRQPWRMAASYLDASFDGDVPGWLPVLQRHEDAWGQVVALARAGARLAGTAGPGSAGPQRAAPGPSVAAASSPMTSSAGRLFDAVSAMLCGRDSINYEGQAAVDLEQLADPAERSSYPVDIDERAVGPPGSTGTFRIMGTKLVRHVTEDIAAGTGPAVIASRFHNALSASIVAACVQARDHGTGLGTVALSGGTFQNTLLAEQTIAGLEEAGFRVLTHARVPTNDGGISLGQAAVASARDAGS
jgi:hydrogenase maturation protein HypF